ncbi:MAG: hypothetical protein VX899_17720 [Myxococcota bacterium]|nr:hypothetical protein [Myxococcota bacterium]
MLLLLLACAPTQIPAARALATGQPDHILGDAEGLTLAWRAERTKPAQLPWSSLTDLELRHLQDGDQLWVRVEGRELQLMGRRGGRLDMEAAMIGAWGPLTPQAVGESPYTLQPWMQVGGPLGLEESVLSEVPAEVQALLDGCVSKRRERNPQLLGALGLRVHGNAEGVQWAAVQADTAQDPMLNDCLLRGLQRQELAGGHKLTLRIEGEQGG